MSEHKPRAIRRWLLFIVLLHWLIFIILLLQGLSKHARSRSAPTVSSPYVEAAPPERKSE